MKLSPAFHLPKALIIVLVDTSILQRSIKIFPNELRCEFLSNETVSAVKVLERFTLHAHIVFGLSSSSGRRASQNRVSHLPWAMMPFSPLICRKFMSNNYSIIRKCQPQKKSSRKNATLVSNGPTTKGDGRWRLRHRLIPPRRPGLHSRDEKWWVYFESVDMHTQVIYKS